MTGQFFDPVPSRREALRYQCGAGELIRKELIMTRTIFAVVLAIGALCAGAEASRKFTESDSLQYTATPNFVNGSKWYGVAAWIRLHSSPTGDQFIVDNADMNGKSGFQLYLSGSTLIFNHHGKTKFGSAQVTASVDLSGIDLTAWTHVAAEVVWHSSSPSEVALYVNNGELVAYGVENQVFSRLSTTRTIVLGNSVNGTDGIQGEVHDVCLINRRWQSGELASMQNESAKDIVVVPGRPDPRLFNPRLRESAADPVHEIDPVVYGEPERGIGPPITYGDQPDTVLVIGDTQHLELEEMIALGSFILAYKDTLKIAAVFHVGDWVHLVSELPEATALTAALAASGVPWACTIGNHDYNTWSNPDRELSLWRGAVPTNLFINENLPWQTWQMCTESPCAEQNDADYAHAFEFYLAGERQIGITLPYGLTDASLTWLKAVSDEVIDQSEPDPPPPMWLSTHKFILAGGYHSPDANLSFEIPVGIAWRTRLRHVSNLSMVMCGHHVTHPPDYAAGQRCDLNCDGQPVNQLLVNGQAVDEIGPGGGFLQILSTHDAANFDVESYIPLLDEFLEGANFVFSLPLCPEGELDCDENGVSDCVDLENPDLDCDDDAFLDSCEIADHLILDCDEDTLLDSCEIADHPELDCNNNDVLDSCAADCDGAFRDCMDCDDDGQYDICEGGWCPWDINGTGVVDNDDITEWILNQPCTWDPGYPCETHCPADVDWNGTVDNDDLLGILLNWGQCDPVF